MIFLQSVVINLVVAFLIFVSFYARKTDRRLNSLVVPVHLPLPTPIATIEIRESAPTSCQPVPNRESRNKSYHIKRQSKDPYTFFRIGNQESKRSNESEGITAQCQMFLSNFDMMKSVKNTLNINGISIIYLIEFLPYNMLQSIIYIFHLDCHHYTLYINIFRSLKLISFPLYLYFISRIFLKN